MASATVCGPVRDGEIRVAIDGTRGDDGEVLCSLYATANGFPGEVEHSVARDTRAPSAGGTCCVFPNIAPGQYAVSILHDEDGDRRMSTSRLGIPREGFGMSNDARPRGIAPPSFEDARFTHKASTRLSASLRYMGSGRGAKRSADTCGPGSFVTVGFDGPGWDAAAGRVKVDQLDGFVVHTTELTLRRDAGSLERFQRLNADMAEALWAHDGLVGFDVSTSEACMVGRTLGVWQNAAAMTEFMYSPEHIAAMQAFPEITVGGKTTHWNVDGRSLPPTWAQAADHIARAAPFRAGH